MVPQPRGDKLPRSARIRGTKEIRSLFKRGRRRRTDHLDVFLDASPVSRPRWGIVVPKHAHGIVERNRLRRRLREVGRREVLPRLWKAERSLDVLVRARREAYGATFEQLRGELVSLTESLCSEPPSSV